MKNSTLKVFIGCAITAVITLFIIFCNCFEKLVQILIFALQR